MAAPQSPEDPIMNQEREAVALRPGDLEWAQEVLDGLRLTPKMIAATGSLQTRRAHHAQNSRIDRIILALRSGGEGWRLVPVEPTEAMIEAYCEAHQRLGFHAWANASFVWPRVLAAAPSPSTHGG